MFSPFILLIECEYRDLNLQNVEFDLLKELKQKFKFKEIELVADKISLKDAFPILKCEFGNETIDLTVALTKETNQELHSFFNIVFTQLDITKLIIRKTELVGVYSLKDNKKILNLEFEDDQLNEFDIKFTIKNNDDTSISIKLFHKLSDERPDLVVAQLLSSNGIQNVQDLINYIDKNHARLANTLNRYASVQQDNLEFTPLEAIKHE